MRASTPKCVLALDAGGTSIKLGLVPFHPEGGGVLDFQELPVRSEGTAAEIAAAYGDAARAGMDCAARRGLEIVGVGVSTPGPFDYENGVSLMIHKYAAIRGMGIRAFIEAATGALPIRFVHDSSAFLLGELAGGDWNCYRSPCAAIIGTGLGFASMLAGELLRNPEGGPGISIFRRPCRDGIAEDFVSKRGIMRTYARLRGEGCDPGGTGRHSTVPDGSSTVHEGSTVPDGSGGPSVKEMARAAREGDEVCGRVFAETGAILAEILAPIMRERGFDCLILGGQIAKAGALLTIPVRRRLESLGTVCDVQIALHIDEAPCLGAARLFSGGEALS
jgi:glucokinase